MILSKYFLVLSGDPRTISFGPFSPGDLLARVTIHNSLGGVSDCFLWFGVSGTANNITTDFCDPRMKITLPGTAQLEFPLHHRVDVNSRFFTLIVEAPMVSPELVVSVDRYTR